MPRGRRHPATPDCAIRGCQRAARSYGLCAEHVQLVPFSERTRAHLACITEQFQAGARAARKVQRIARSNLKASRASREAVSPRGEKVA